MPIYQFNDLLVLDVSSDSDTYKRQCSNSSSEIITPEPRMCN